MRKIHFLMGIIFLSTTLVSCSNDDNFKQEIEKNTAKNKEEKLKIQQASKINSQSNHTKLYCGDEDEDKDKNTTKK